METYTINHKTNDKKSVAVPAYMLVYKPGHGSKLLPFGEAMKAAEDRGDSRESAKKIYRLAEECALSWRMTGWTARTVRNKSGGFGPTLRGAMRLEIGGAFAQFSIEQQRIRDNNHLDTPIGLLTDLGPEDMGLICSIVRGAKGHPAEGIPRIKAAEFETACKFSVFSGLTLREAADNLILVKGPDVWALEGDVSLAKPLMATQDVTPAPATPEATPGPSPEATPEATPEAATPEATPEKKTRKKKTLA